MADRPAFPHENVHLFYVGNPGFTYDVCTVHTGTYSLALRPEFVSAPRTEPRGKPENSARNSVAESLGHHDSRGYMCIVRTYRYLPPIYLDMKSELDQNYGSTYVHIIHSIGMVADAGNDDVILDRRR